MDLFDAKRSTKHHNFASSIEQKRAYESATAGLASLPATNPSARQSAMSLVNIKDLIDKYAQAFFAENEREYQKQVGRNTQWKDLVKVVDWSRFQFRHAQRRYEDAGEPGTPKSQVLFRSTFVNDTEKEQTYQLQAERKTVASCSFELFEGWVNEAQAEVKLSVPIPGCALEAGAGFRSEYVLETTRTKTVQEEMNWSVQSSVRIPGMSKTTAELLVQEREYQGRFEIKTYFRGEVVMRLLNQEGVELCQMELGDLESILTPAKGFCKDGQGIYKMTRGQCKARFGIDQKIELHQRALDSPASS